MTVFPDPVGAQTTTLRPARSAAIASCWNGSSANGYSASKAEGCDSSITRCASTITLWYHGCPPTGREKKGDSPMPIRALALDVNGTLAGEPTEPAPDRSPIAVQALL